MEQSFNSQNWSFNKFQPEQSSSSVSHIVDTQTTIQKLEKGDCKKSNISSKIKNESTHAHSKVTTKVSNKSTESTGYSTITPALPDTVNLPSNSSSLPSLADIQQSANIQLKVDLRIRELQQLSNSVKESKSNPSEVVLLIYLLNIRSSGPMNMFWLAT